MGKLSIRFREGWNIGFKKGIPLELSIPQKVSQRSEGFDLLQEHSVTSVLKCCFENLHNLCMVCFTWVGEHTCVFLSVFGHHREVLSFTPSSVKPDGIPIEEDSLRMASIAAYAASVTVRPWVFTPINSAIFA